MRVDAAPLKTDDWSGYPGHEHVHFLNPTNIESFLNNSESALVMFMVRQISNCCARTKSMIFVSKN